MRNAVRKLAGRIVKALGVLLASAIVVAWFWFVMPAVVDFAKHVHYPDKLLLLGGAVGLLIGGAAFRSLAWVAERIDPALRDRTRPGK